MDSTESLEQVPCYYCGATEAALWGQEGGYRAVKCARCGLVYVSPRPPREAIDDSARTGQHATEGRQLSVTGHYRRGRVRARRRLIRRMFDDVARHANLRWLDIGAGFGELSKAVSVVFDRADVTGIEPNEAKRRVAASHGIALSDVNLASLPQGVFDIASLMNLWSHLPDPAEFLTEVRGLLTDRGRVLIQTGTGADLPDSAEYPDALLLPDHLSFASERHVVGILERTGFRIERIWRRRVDTPAFALNRVAKLMLGRSSRLVLPYRSPFRTIYVRASVPRTRPCVRDLAPGDG